MKRLADFTIEDLAAEPVWRFEGGDGEDAIFVAERRDSLSQNEDEIFLAATEFFLPDSSQYLGFCFPVDGVRLDYLQPVIVTPKGQVRFWFDGVIAREVLSIQWNVLGKRAEEVFPVRFRCRVPVDGRKVTGVIPSVETSADASRARDGGPAASTSGEAGEIPYRLRRRDGSVLSARPTRVRQLFASRARIAEKRTAPRRRVEMMVEFDQAGSRGTGVTSVVSGSGMSVRSARPPNGGPVVNMTVHLPGGRNLLLKGRVVPGAAPPDLSGSPGFALCLTEKPDEYDEFLSRFFDTSE